MKRIISALIVSLAFWCWFAGKITGAISSRPKSITGTNPAGASEVVKITAKKEAGIFNKARKSLGKYMKKKYPVDYAKYKKIFS